jgi:PEP-CTERM motif
MFRKTLTTLAAGLMLAAGTAAADPGRSYTDFSSGTGGWAGINPSEPVPGMGTWVDPSLGNAAPALHSVIPDTFMAYWSNQSSAVTGNYTAAPSATISLDIDARSIIYLFSGMEVQRQLVVELRDHDNTSGGLPYTSVWYELGTIGAGMGWQNFSVTIADTGAAALPTGWRGYGAETELGDPILPAGTSFSDVLRGVDEIVFTTAVPGWFYGFTYFDVALDNIQVTAVPEPATVALQALGLLGVAAAVRRRRRTA